MYPEDSERERSEVGKSSYKSNWMLPKIKYNMIWYDIAQHNTRLLQEKTESKG